MSKNTAATGSDIENLFHDLLARANGRGFLSVRREGDGTVVTLVPANPGAARIEAYVEDDGGIVSVEIGKKLIIEVLGSASQPLLSSLRTVCEAVLAGKVEEDVWEVGSVTTKSIGKITYGGRVHTYRWFGGALSLRKSVKSHFHYEPYAPDAGNQPME